MAASHKTKLEMPISGTQLGEVAKTLEQSEGWKIDQQSQDSITFMVGLNLFSWGEKLTIQFGNDSITIRSECRSLCNSLIGERTARTRTLLLR